MSYIKSYVPYISYVVQRVKKCFSLRHSFCALLIISTFILYLCFSCSNVISYFAARHSMVLLIITFGGLGGLGAGLAFGPILSMVGKVGLTILMCLIT